MGRRSIVFTSQAKVVDEKTVKQRGFRPFTLPKSRARWLASIYDPELLGLILSVNAR